MTGKHQPGKHQPGNSQPDNTQSISQDIARAAAHWLALLHSGEATEQDSLDCAQWRSADPRHEQAWQRGQSLQRKLGLLPAPIATAALNRAPAPRISRRQALKILTLLIAVPATGYLLHDRQPWQRWTTDHHTGPGEQRQVALADGTRLSINTASLVDVRFTADQRLIRLHRGEILVDTGNDPGHATRRPFRVATEQGMLEALGTRFTVKTLEKDGPTHLAVFDGAVTITPAASGETLLLQAGQQVRFSRSDIAPATALGDAEPPWSRGLLIADDMRFGDFIDELSRYRSGILRCDPRAAELRINGAFRLDNTDAIIRALPATLPVDVSYLTRYWVSIAYRES